MDQLKSYQPPLSHPSAAPPTAPHPPYASPPPQSRDATVASRFFPATPSSNGIVLVPSSSPLGPDSKPHPYYPYSDRTSHDVAQLPSRQPNPPWVQAQKNRTVDPLSAPSGFIFNGAGNASFRGARIGNDSSSSSVTEREDAPPRKRLNRCPAEDAFDGMDVVSSPEIRRPTHRRRIASDGTDIQSITSDDSLPEGQVLSGPSTSRFTKIPPTPSSSSPPASSTVSDEAKFTRFKYTMPQESPARVRAAWVQANGDVKRATALLGDSAWSPVSPSSNKEQPEGIGRVQELDEESRARRAAAKEKGKKSMIYANRSNLENNSHSLHVVSTPPSVKRPLDTSVLSPETPIPRQPRKRLKRTVVDSDEDADAESDHDIQNGRGSDEMRALNYLNISGSEALQELTGTIFPSLKDYSFDLEFARMLA